MQTQNLKHYFGDIFLDSCEMGNMSKILRYLKEQK